MSFLTVVYILIGFAYLAQAVYRVVFVEDGDDKVSDRKFIIGLLFIIMSKVNIIIEQLV